MKRFLVAVLMGGLISLGLVLHRANAGEVDTLLQKLVEKGVLSASEAQEVRTETNEEIAKTEKQRQEDYKTLSKDILPDWVKNTTLKGDFRLRYAYNHTNDSLNDVQRGRIRLRFGFETKINDKLTLGACLATGLASPNDNPYNATTGNLTRDYARSANQTFTGAFSKKPIDLDLAYAKYSPTSWISFVGGKMANPFWDPEGKFIWDDNIRPEGAALLFNKSLNSQLTTFLNATFFVLDQNSGDHDAPDLIALQPGAVYNFSNDVSLKGAVSYYNWANVKGRNLPGSSYSMGSYGNTRNSSGNVLHDFSNVIPQAELGVNHPLSKIGLDFFDLPYLSIFGEYLDNIQVSKNGTGYVGGFKLGSAKIEKWADWQFQYDYRKIEADAIPDILPDADFYNSVAGGTTGVSGSRFVFQWGLGKNTWLAFNVYRDKAIRTGLQETTVYADWNMKF